eukprot:gene5177-47715_t
MNGALQCLANTPALSDHFARQQKGGGSGGAIAREFGALMRG